MVEFLLLLLPVAAASGWYAAVRSGRALSGRARRDRLHSDYFAGLNYLVNEQPDKAIEVLTKMTELDPDTCETHLALGSLFRKSGEVDRAIKIHQNLVTQESVPTRQRGRAMLELGQDYMRAGLFDRAEGLFQELVSSEMFADQALRELTDIYQLEKEWDKAVQSARQREAVNGRSYGRVIAYLLCEQAELAVEQGNVEAALGYVREALDVSSQCARASLIEGHLLARQGEYRAAIRAYKRVEQQDPDYVTEIIRPLKDCYFSIGRMSEMMEYLRYILERYGGVTPLLELSESIMDTEGPREAVLFLTEQLRLRPSVRGLDRLIELGMEKADQPTLEYLTLLKEMTNKLLDNNNFYECRQCGYSVRQLHWQCPSCKYWGTIKPILGVQGE